MKSKIKAFGFIEIGFFLLISGIIFSSILPLFKSVFLISSKKEVAEKHKLITQSLAAFVIQNGYLPTASLPRANGFSIDFHHTGIVPYQTLGLDEKTVKDQRGYWFTYAVTPSLTEIPSIKNTIEVDLSSSFCTVQKSEQDLMIQDYLIPENDLVSFVLVHHHNGNGFIQADGKRNFILKDHSQKNRCEEMNASDIKKYCIAPSGDTVFWVTRNNFSAQYLHQLCEKKTNQEVLPEDLNPFE